VKGNVMNAALSGTSAGNMRDRAVDAGARIP
jgi:hypothetical protein